MALTEERAQALKNLHGEVAELTMSGGEVVYVRTPSVDLYARFRSQSSDPKKKDAAVGNLVRACVLHPESAEFETMVSRRPGLIDSVGLELMTLAGLDAVVEKKVL